MTRSTWRKAATIAATSSIAIISTTITAQAKEGMFTPEQVPAIASDMRKAGLRLNPKSLTDLTGFPMGAVISLGGCTASFVSETGLVATNHDDQQSNAYEYLHNQSLAAEVKPSTKSGSAPCSSVYESMSCPLAYQSRPA